MQFSKLSVSACLALVAGFATASPTGSIKARQSETGTATYYDPAGGYGSCGTILQNTDYIVALGNAWMDGKYQAPYCGDTVSVTYNGKTISVKVADTCAGCDATHIDLSQSAFEALADISLGVIDVTWSI